MPYILVTEEKSWFELFVDDIFKTEKEALEAAVGNNSVDELKNVVIAEVVPVGRIGISTIPYVKKTAKK